MTLTTGGNTNDQSKVASPKEAATVTAVIKDTPTKPVMVQTMPVNDESVSSSKEPVSDDTQNQ